MKTLKRTVKINKPIEEVFAFTLNPANTPKWVESVVVEHTNEWPVKLGTIYRNQNRTGEWSEYKVTAFEQDKTFTLSKLDGSRMRYTFTSPDANTTELEYEWTSNSPDKVFLQRILSKLEEVLETEMLSPRPSHQLYNPKLSQQWTEWVELENTEGSRQKEIYPVIMAWLAHAKPHSIADLGCGQGICSQLVGAGISYVGIDASASLIARANKLYATPNRAFTVGNVYNAPLEDSSTDAVMSVWVWSHLEDLTKAAKEMHRILKPGGKFMIINANPDTYEDRKGFYSSYKIEGKLLVGNFDLGSGKELSDSTLYLHLREDMADALKAAHLAIDETETLGYKEIYPGGLYIAIMGRKKS